MLFIEYLLFLGVLFVDSEAGGHNKGHDHVKLHVPEFIHHDHHTKVVTIHHHHHKPKTEHHHHHHHHPKPHMPHGPPPYHHTHNHKKTSTHTVAKEHTTHLGKKSGHRGHSGHHLSSKHHSVHGHGNKHFEPSASYDPPSINYESPSVNYAAPTVTYIYNPSYGNDYGSNSPAAPNIISSPHVHGVVHTVKQIKVYDSLPGVLPIGNNGATGYEVTEQNDEGEEDIFTSVGSLPQSYPGTYGFVRSAADEPGNYAFSDLSQSNSIQSANNDPFGNAQPQPSYANLEDFTIQNHVSSAPVPTPQSFESGDIVEIDNPASAEVDNDVITDLLSFAEGIQDDTPVTFSREAGIQHAIKTGGVETVSY